MRPDLWLAALLILQPSCREPGGGMPPLPGASGPPTRISGDVRQELSAGRYTYYLLKAGDGAERWVVVADRTHRGAKRLTVDGCRSRRDFFSRHLDRRFAVLEFCAIPSPPTKGARS
jgi:hypothetical protein